MEEIGVGNTRPKSSAKNEAISVQEDDGEVAKVWMGQQKQALTCCWVGEYLHQAEKYVQTYNCYIGKR